MKLPTPRGALTERLVAALRAAPDDAAALEDLRMPSVKPIDEHDDAVRTIRDDDLQLLLFACYELHYRGFDDVDDRWEWSPALLTVRAAAERVFDDALVALAGEAMRRSPAEVADIPHALIALAERDRGPSLAAYMARHATREQFREFLIHRSIYHLKEADPHSWAIPRMEGRSKAALVEIQADEYGGGRPHRMHSALFAQAMRGLGLDDSYGAYIDLVPGGTLALSNAMSYFGLHRRWRGAIVGHLAAFELTSSIPNRRYAQGFRRLGGDGRATRFFDEHVQADAVHEQIAVRDMCAPLVEREPMLAGQVLFGANCCLELDQLAASALLASWERRESSLRVAPAALAGA